MWHRVRSFLRSSMWMVPLLGTALAILLAPAVRWIDSQMHPVLFDFNVEGARSLLAAFIAAGISYIIFLASALLLAVQLMSSQLSPRVIREFMLDWSYRVVLGLFVFNLFYSIAVLARTAPDPKTIPEIQQLPIFVSTVLNVASIGAFLYIIDYALRNFRPSAIVNRVSAQGFRVIEQCYPLPSDSSEIYGPLDLGSPVKTFLHSGKSGVILAVDAKGLAEHARLAGAVLVLRPQVGDFVAKGEILLEAYIAGDEINDSDIEMSIAFGPERTMEQDPAFAFRVLVDIAIKALSPAINDPTTAVLAIDQLQRLLLMIGRRRLDYQVTIDDSGQNRFYLPKPCWEDFVSLAMSEIRIYGAGSLQVCRRLEAMIKNTVELLPSYRAPALFKELELLRSQAERSFPDPEDRLRAITPDAMGLGGGLSM